MKISKDWATPLTIGSFIIMAVTGIMMFFHISIGISKLAHEWLGWFMVAAVFLHVLFHWKNFSRYFTGNLKATSIILVCVIILFASFTIPAKKKGPRPRPQQVSVLLSSATLETLAPLTGSSIDTLIAKLKTSGYTIKTLEKN